MIAGAPPATPLKITGCGVVSGAGIGLGTLDTAATTAAPAVEPPAGEDYPPGPLRPVPHFDVREHLGRKGTRNLDRTTALGLVACQLALGDRAERMPEEERNETGVVIGTSMGSVRSSSEFSRDTLVQERPYLVNPSLFPNTIMNCCASQIAIRHSLRGVNATLAGGQSSGLHALRYARNAIGQGHARRLLVGAVEELSAQSAWAWRRTKALKRTAAVGEGAAVFVIEDGDGAEPLAELLACEVVYTHSRSLRDRVAGDLTRVITRALHRSGVDAGQVDVVAYGSTGLVALGSVEARAVRAALGGEPRDSLAVKEKIGECFSASVGLQLAALLAHWESTPATRTRYGLVTSLGFDGNVGCAVLARPADTEGKPR
jgi:3-oxoacyl-[acyl-carrier-protein] synthase II